MFTAAEQPGRRRATTAARPVASLGLVSREGVDEVPDAWLGGEALFPTLAEHRQAYVTYLSERLNGEGRDAVRRALVEALLNGNRAELVLALDDTMLGVRPKPSSVLRVA